MRTKKTLILFTKAAQICRVKTRMWPNLSHRESLYLHKALTANAINKFNLNPHFKLIVYTTQTETNQYYHSRKLIIKKQHGLDLGARMHHAISQELINSQSIVLIGSDCLELDVSYINNAFMQLSTVNDVVFGPTKDGGYALIGMKKNNQYLFDNISWGTSSVFTQSLEAANNYRCNVKSLNEISDIDTIDDLYQLKNQKTLPKWANCLIANK